MILIWMPVYNEARNLRKAIDSVLAQTFADFELVISDNHSTDGSGAIIDAAAKDDPRIRKVSPPQHLPSMDHARFIYSEVLSTAQYKKYSIFIGGHDEWKRDLLQTLWWRAEAEPGASIVYTDSCETDDAGNIYRHWRGYIHAQDIERPFLPHHVLIGLTHNIVWGGLWREDKRRQIKLRHPCVGADHLMIAEIALLGDIIYQPGSMVYLRRAADKAEGDKAYIRKHLPQTVLDQPIQDFINQLEWAAHLVDKAVEGDVFRSQPPMRAMLKSSLISAYICRYYNNLNGFEGGVETFFNHPKVRTIMGAETLCVQSFEELNAEQAQRSTGQ